MTCWNWCWLYSWPRRFAWFNARLHPDLSCSRIIKGIRTTDFETLDLRSKGCWLQGWLITWFWLRIWQWRRSYCVIYIKYKNAQDDQYNHRKYFHLIGVYTVCFGASCFSFVLEIGVRLFPIQFFTSRDWCEIIPYPIFYFKELLHAVHL